MAVEEYWTESVMTAFEEADLAALPKQIESVAHFIMISHENINEAFGSPQGPHPLQEENERLRAQVKAEQEKVTCPDCKGKGIERFNGPYHYSESDCFKCKGKGRIAP